MRERLNLKKNTDSLLSSLSGEIEIEDSLSESERKELEKLEKKSYGVKGEFSKEKADELKKKGKQRAWLEEEEANKKTNNKTNKKTDNKTNKETNTKANIKTNRKINEALFESNTFSRDPHPVEYQCLKGKQKEILKYLIEEKPDFLISEEIQEHLEISKDHLSNTLRFLRNRGFLITGKAYRYRPYRINPSILTTIH